MSASRIRDLLLIFVPAFLVVGAAFWATFQFVEPAPPKTISISTGGPKGAYFGYGQQYAKILKRSGITLKVVPSAGSIQNLHRLTTTDEAGVNIALMQGGISNQDKTAGVMSLGRIFLEPLWVFYRKDLEITKLTDLKDKRIAVGPSNSGTRHLATSLLTANNITDANSQLLKLSGKNAIDALLKGTVDAVFLVIAPRSPFIKELLKNQNLKLMNFERAEAYTRIFPFLSKVTLPQGTIDFVKNIPANDISLVATSAALVAKDDLHPALAGLLVGALKEVHAKGDIFQKIGQFPQSTDPEYPISDDTERSYKEGVPFLQRYLPFWLASFLQRKFLLLLPIATVLFPVIKLAPLFYNWRVRNRLLHWYQQLKLLEQRIGQDETGAQIIDNKAELSRIETAVQNIPVPKDFSDQFYHLRGAVSLVHKRLAFQEKEQG